MSKVPYCFDFRYNDWKGGTYHLSHVARACYLDLLIYQFQNGQIPERKLTLMNICGITDQGQWDSIWDELQDKFEPLDDTRRGNKVMEEIRVKTLRRWEINRANGARGGRPKGSKNENPSVNPSVSSEKPMGKREEGSNTSTSTGTSSGAPKRRNNASDYSEEFLVFWSNYPPGRKTKKGAAWASFQKLPDDDQQAAIKGAAEYAASAEGQGEFVAGPVPWLNQRRWEDDREAWMSEEQKIEADRRRQVEELLRLGEESEARRLKAMAATRVRTRA